MKTTFHKQIARIALSGAFLLGCAHAESYRGQFSFAGAQSPQAAQEADVTYTVERGAGEKVIQTVSTLENEMIGGIDWDENVVFSVGDGVAPTDAISPAQARVRAKRAAIDEAMARMLETVKEVQVDASSTTRNFVNESRAVQTRVSGLVKNAEVVEIRQADDGSYQVKMRMPMGGPRGLNAALLPVQMVKIQDASSVTRPAKTVSRTVREDSKASSSLAAPASPAPESSAPAATPEVAAEPAPVASAATQYTSLMIDARGLEASPAAFPRILSDSGAVLYDLSKADPNAVAMNGLCAYKKSLAKAKLLPLAGSEPLVLKALDMSGNNRVDVILSEEDAQTLVMADASGGFLQKAQVIVIID